MLSLPFYLTLPISLFIFGLVKYKRTRIVVLVAYVVAMLVMFSAMGGHAIGLINELISSPADGTVFVMMRIFFLDPLLGIMVSFLLVQGFKKLRRDKSK